jgi:Protein of unknown function (DUF2934)
MASKIHFIRRRSDPVLHSPALPPFVVEKIRLRAYQFYEERGRIGGHAEEDWLRAEREVLSLISRSAKLG